MMPESTLDAVDALPDFEKLDITPKPELLQQTVILKLNGGLGTGMGLDKAKSLLPVTGDNTFLDLIAKQVDWMKKKYECNLNFMLMNSFSTSEDTKAALSKYPDLGTGSDLEFGQNKAPKVTKEDLTPATWPAGPDNEWCPPGHGDLYPAMLGSGTLDKLLGKGLQYAFISNSDNLGATMDLKILTYFVESGAPFMMEVATRTDADKKGGHLATMKAGGGLTLRESAQCPKDDEKAFQDTSKYTYFNLIVRRKPKENNFKAILHTIRSLMNSEDTVIPDWLHDLFLGYGDPGAAQYWKLPTMLSTVDFRDTFIDQDHILESFPDAEDIDVPEELQRPFKLEFEKVPGAEPGTRPMEKIVVSAY